MKPNEQQALERVWIIGRPQDFKGQHEGVVRFQFVPPEVAPSIEYVRADLLQQPASERCDGCGHSGLLVNGECVSESRNAPGRKCGHRCVFPATGAPNLAITELLRAALEHPESAEGYIRQAMEMLSATTGAGEGTSWCDSCKSYHPIPRDAAHKAELQCSAPATVAEGPRLHWPFVAKHDSCAECAHEYEPPPTVVDKLSDAPVQPPAAAQDDELRELALRIAEIHPPIVNGRWDGERSKTWVLQIIGLLSRRFPPTEATQVAVEAAATEIFNYVHETDGGHKADFTQRRVIDIISKHCADAREVERLKKELSEAYYEECEICEQVIISANGDKVYTFIVCGRCWNEAQKKLTDARANAIRECVTLVRDAASGYNRWFNNPQTYAAEIAEDIAKRLESLTKKEGGDGPTEEG